VSLVGQVVDGRYRVQSHLADGGMASVYVAVDLRLERDVALKIMRPDLARDENFVSRFRREARSAARLSHPNVVGVFDQGSDNGHVFLAMELVTGKTLRDVVRDEGPLTPRAALDIIEPVLEALDAAHRAGIVHRDIKPENVILREDGVVKVADFGLARAVTTDTVTAHTDVLLGTAAYLSPEQVERGIADPRSDVYSAGLLLYEMLTGVKAFPGDSPIQVAYQHVHGTVPVPSARIASVPGELDALVALATARDPDDRPTDAGDLLAQARRSRDTLSTDELDHRPSTGDPGRGGNPTMPLGRTTTRAVPRAPVPDEPGAARRRRRWPALLAAVLVLLLLAGAGTWWFTLGPGARVEVPRLAGMSQQDAVDRLTGQHLDPVTQPQYSEHVRAGRVISAKPSAGASVARGSDVQLAVSKGPERHDVPRLVGATRSEAKALLAKHHLRVGRVEGAYDENIAKGAVVATSPEQGKPLKRDAKVSLTLSRGPQPIPVADVVGQSKQDATSRLEGAGLTVDAGHEDYSTKYDQGTVMAQSPANGTLHRGDTVQLTISKGPEMVEVPDVGGKQTGEAEQILTAAGFKVSYTKILGGVFQTVRMQKPEAGSMAPKGSTITLTIV
jgi:serine/threonine-protein kinase